MTTRTGDRWRDGIPVLAPLSWIYRGCVAAMRALRTPPSPPAGGPRVVSVGNLEVGGSGKTPLAIWLLERAARAGVRAAYVSRGFASQAEKGPWVTFVAGETAPPPPSFAGLRLVARDRASMAEVAGDEGALVARRASAASLFLARDKRRAVECAARAGAEIVVVDDAFQSFALARHLDLLLLDAERPLGNGRVLPAGRLRETPSAIARADVVVFNGAGDDAGIAQARARAAPWLRPGQRVYGLRRAITLLPATASAASGSPSSALLVAGIAKPEEFQQSVERLGVRVVDMRWFRDHHRYTSSDVRAILARGDEDMITTEKDWVKLARFEWGGRRVWVARLDVDLVGGEPVDTWLFG